MVKLKLIIGIGNPDEQYQNTRHNVGLMFVDLLAKKMKASDWKFDKKLNSFILKIMLEKSSVILAKPQIYVNKSGESVAKLKNFYKVKSENIIITHDDLDIEFGNFKLSFGKNSGGHKGVESVIRALKTKRFYRLRIGLATKTLQNARRQSDKKRDEFVRNFVLSKFTDSENDKIKDLFKEALGRLSQIAS